MHDSRARRGIYLSLRSDGVMFGYQDKRRVWIDSQTEEEIKRGITEAKPLSEYDVFPASAYLRAKERLFDGYKLFARIITGNMDVPYWITLAPVSGLPFQSVVS